jgi:hypothetical protein
VDEINIKINGNLITGIRGFFCDDKENFTESIPNSIGKLEIVDYLKKSSYDYASLYTGRIILKDNSIVGYSGRRKFFYFVDDDKGLLVFDSIFKDDKKFDDKRIDCYIESSKFLEKNGFFPKIYGDYTVDMNFSVTSMYNNNVGKFKIKKRARALLIDRVYTPSYFIDTNNDDHLSVFRRGWKNKSRKPIHLSCDKINMMYGKDFSNDHPNFNLLYYKKFCKKMNKICSKNRSIFKKIQKQSNPNTKYGNVIYNLKNKKWYFVDLEANI